MYTAGLRVGDIFVKVVVSSLTQNAHMGQTNCIQMRNNQRNYDKIVYTQLSK